jgi:putative flippase GtrA
MQKEAIRYVLFGFVVKALNLGILYVMYRLTQHVVLSGSISFVFSILILFFINSRVIFYSNVSLSTVLKYITTMLVSLCTYLLLLNIIFNIYPHIVVAGIITSVLNYPIHFLINKYWSFTQKHVSHLYSATKTSLPPEL